MHDAAVSSAAVNGTVRNGMLWDGTARDDAVTDAPARDGAGSAREVAERVTDPELPMLTLAELGVLRAVEETGDGGVTVTITPTYSGCPATAAMRAELAARLRAAGYRPEIRTVLAPALTTDWITAEGRRKLAAAGIAPPGPAPRRGPGPVPLTLDTAPARRTGCPRCGSADTVETSRFGAAPCRALWRCRACGEPFERFKEL